MAFADDEELDVGFGTDEDVECVKEGIEALFGNEAAGGEEDARGRGQAEAGAEGELGFLGGREMGDVDATGEDLDAVRGNAEGLELVSGEVGVGEDALHGEGGVAHELMTGVEEGALDAVRPIEALPTWVEVVLEGGDVGERCGAREGPSDPRAEDIIAGRTADEGEASGGGELAVVDGGRVNELCLVLVSKASEGIEIGEIGETGEAAVDWEGEVRERGTGRYAIGSDGDLIAALVEVMAEGEGVGLHAAEGGRELSEDEEQRWHRERVYDGREVLRFEPVGDSMTIGWPGIPQ